MRKLQPNRFRSSRIKPDRLNMDDMPEIIPRENISHKSVGTDVSNDNNHTTGRSTSPVNQEIIQKHQGNEGVDLDSEGIDISMSLPPEISLKRWQEIIQNSETQNSALRISKEERYPVEDMISELQRQLHVKTSMNEVARLGLLVIFYDFKRNKERSIIYRVKKA